MNAYFFCSLHLGDILIFSAYNKMNIKAFFKIGLTLLLLVFVSFYSCCAYGQSVNSADSVIASVQNLSSDSDKVSTLLDMVPRAYCEDSVYKLAVANEAKRLAERIKWYRGSYLANFTIGKIYFECSRNYVKAFECFENNVKLANSAGNKSDEAISWETIGKYHQQLSDYTSTLQDFDKALEVNPGPDVKIAILADKGIVCNQIGAYPQALESYNAALTEIDALEKSKKYTAADDGNMKAALYINMGELYLSKNQPDRALEMYTNANKMARLINDKVYVVSSLDGIGKVYKQKKENDKAITYYQSALDSCAGLTNFKYEVRVLNELANIYLIKWSIPNAQLYADSSLRLAEAQGYTDLLSKSNATLGDVYLRQGKYDLAIFYLKKALDIAKQTKILEDQKDVLYLLTTTYQQSGQFEAAFKTLNDYNTVKDSLAVFDKQNEFALKQVQMEYRSKQIVDSAKQAGVYDRQITRQLTYTYSSVIASVFILLLAFFIYRNYNTQKKYNELLSKEKERHLAHIEAQSNVLSDIAHTQAHDVRGPVATILGLLQLFNHEDPTDPINGEVISKLNIATEKLDNVVKEVVYKENRLRYKDGPDKK